MGPKLDSLSANSRIYQQIFNKIKAVWFFLKFILFVPIIITSVTDIVAIIKRGFDE